MNLISFELEILWYTILHIAQVIKEISDSHLTSSTLIAYVKNKKVVRQTAQTKPWTLRTPHHSDYETSSYNPSKRMDVFHRTESKASWSRNPSWHLISTNREHLYVTSMNKIKGDGPKLITLLHLYWIDSLLVWRPASLYSSRCVYLLDPEHTTFKHLSNPLKNSNERERERERVPVFLNFRRLPIRFKNLHWFHSMYA